MTITNKATEPSIKTLQADVKTLKAALSTAQREKDGLVQCSNCRKCEHALADCFWPGEGKEGQFPEWFINLKPVATPPQPAANAVDSHPITPSTSIHFSSHLILYSQLHKLFNLWTMPVFMLFFAETTTLSFHSLTCLLKDSSFTPTNTWIVAYKKPNPWSSKQPDFQQPCLNGAYQIWAYQLSQWLFPHVKTPLDQHHQSD